MLRWAVCAFAVAIGGLAAAAGAEDPLVIERADRRTNHFAGRDAAVGMIVRGGGDLQGSIAWTLTVDDRPLARGVVGARHAGPDPTRVAISVPLPEVRDAIVVDGRLTTVLIDPEGKRLMTSCSRLRIFPEDPFADRRRWLESLEIALVDPDGATAAVLEAAGVPFTLVPRNQEIATTGSPVVVVGEGVSWAERPGLPRDLAFLAARGASVLCLAPLEGTMPLPGSADEPGPSGARSLSFRRADVVAELDRRLDDGDWSAAGPTVVSRLAVAAAGAAVIVRAGDDPAGWPWLEAGFPPRPAGGPSGTLLVCGLGIVAHWNETPAARYLFAAILERLSQKAAADTSLPEAADAAPPLFFPTKLSPEHAP